MYLFLLFSIPLFLIHLTREERFSKLVEHRKCFFFGMLWGAIAGFLLFALHISMRVHITPSSLYARGLLLYFLFPAIFALAPLLPLCRASKHRKTIEPVLFNIQLSGFFIAFNIAIYFIHYGIPSQFLLLQLPAIYLIAIPVLGKALWRARRFELHWNILSIFLFLLILFALPVIYVLHEMLRPILSWGAGIGILSIFLLLGAFLNYLEQGIQFRLNLEMKLGSIFRTFRIQKR